MREARERGLPTNTEMSKEVYQLKKMYPQTTQRRPSMEYILTPYDPPAERKGR